ncbi:MAG: ABC transporter ATP-binding protein [Firmicutes bacterium]|nr:ABC transporter ATP-binding protein [Bacillota bacterium]
MAFIKASNISFNYQKGENVLNNLSLELNKEEFTSIIGPNGSGKTTLGKLLIGLLKPVKGKVLINDRDILTMTLGEIGKLIGYLFQNPEKQLFSTSVEEEITFIMKLKGMDRKIIETEKEKILDKFSLKHLRKEFPFNLSQGEKQRLALASIFVNKPKFLILDEPTTGLDIKRKEILSSYINILRKEKIGMAVISHDKSFINKHSDRIIEINRGGIVGDRKK